MRRARPRPRTAHDAEGRRQDYGRHPSWLTPPPSLSRRSLVPNNVRYQDFGLEFSSMSFGVTTSLLCGRHLRLTLAAPTGHDGRALGSGGLGRVVVTRSRWCHRGNERQGGE
jgi:hypothetical protein